MIQTYYSAKGGQGTTTVAAAYSLTTAVEIAEANARTTGHLVPVTVLDFDGDMAAVFGIAEQGTSVLDQVAAGASVKSAVAATTVVRRNTDGQALVEYRWIGRPEGHGLLPIDSIIAHLRAEVQRDPARHFVIDAGTIVDGSPRARFASGSNLLVTRGCYLALRRALRIREVIEPSSILFVEEPDRALSATDASAVVGVPVSLVVPVDPSIARAVDAGLFAHRIPPMLLDTFSSRPAFV